LKQVVAPGNREPTPSVSCAGHGSFWHHRPVTKVMGRRLTMLVLFALPLACGNSGGGAATTGDNLVGPVDVAAAPATLAMTCGSGVSVALQMPCLIGLDLAGRDVNGTGVHTTECRLAAPDQPLAWPFLLPLADVRANPSAPLEAPADLPTVTGSGEAIDLAGDSVRLSGVTGALTFSRVDPTARAFIGTFSGTLVWIDQAGAQTSCQVDGPLWGAPGDFR
jgi:hypothetical protein